MEETALPSRVEATGSGDNEEGFTIEPVAFVSPKSKLEFFSYL